MITFKIVDRDENLVNLRQLNQEAVNLWGKENCHGYIATPNERRAITQHFYSFTSVIGESIAHPSNRSLVRGSGWEGVIQTMCAETLGEVFIDHEDPTSLRITEARIRHIQDLMDDFKPYLQLIQFWASKGYQPRLVVEEDPE